MILILHKNIYPSNYIHYIPYLPKALSKSEYKFFLHQGSNAIESSVIVWREIVLTKWGVKPLAFLC